MLLPKWEESPGTKGAMEIKPSIHVAVLKEPYHLDGKVLYERIFGVVGHCSTRHTEDTP